MKLKLIAGGIFVVGALLFAQYAPNAGSISGSVTTCPNASTPCVVVGPAADGAAVSGNPVRIGLKDTAGNTQDMLSDTSGTPVLIRTSNDGDAIANTAGGNVITQSGGAGWLRIMPWAYNGATWDREFVCSNTASVSVTAAATTEIIPLTASQRIRICSGLLSISLTGTATIVQGTGSNCASSQTALTGAIALTTASPIPFNGGTSPLLIGTTANAVCITAATGNVTGWFQYAKF